MATRFVPGLLGVMLAFVVPAPAFAAQSCLANGKSFNIGETACLTVDGESRLARCDMVLNNTSWQTIGDKCSGENPATTAPGSSTPLPPRLSPTEPTEN